MTLTSSNELVEIFLKVMHICISSIAYVRAGLGQRSCIRIANVRRHCWVGGRYDGINETDSPVEYRAFLAEPCNMVYSFFLPFLAVLHIVSFSKLPAGSLSAVGNCKNL